MQLEAVACVMFPFPKPCFSLHHLIILSLLCLHATWSIWMPAGSTPQPASLAAAASICGLGDAAGDRFDVQLQLGSAHVPVRVKLGELIKNSRHLRSRAQDQGFVVGFHGLD